MGDLTLLARRLTMGEVTPSGGCVLLWGSCSAFVVQSIGSRGLLAGLEEGEREWTILPPCRAILPLAEPAGAFRSPCGSSWDLERCMYLCLLV